MCVVPAFVQNTVDSLPQYTVTTVTTNDVLISSLSTENSNVLTKITTTPEIDPTDKSDSLLTTEINKIIISSSVPTKMFKGDDLHFDKNDMPDMTTIEPMTTDSVTITEPSIKIFDEYTTKNAFKLSDERQENENNVGSTSSTTWADSDEKTTPVTTTDINEENETNTDEFQSLTSEPNFQTSTVFNLRNNSDNVRENSTQHSVSKTGEITNKFDSVTSEANLQISTVPNLINNSDNFIDITTQYFVPKTAEMTTMYDNNAKVITSNDGTESTLTITTINSQKSTTENTMGSTQMQQDSFKTTTVNPIENETKYFSGYFDDNLSLTTDTSDVVIDPNLITESVTKSQNKININDNIFMRIKKCLC